MTGGKRVERWKALHTGAHVEIGVYLPPFPLFHPVLGRQPGLGRCAAGTLLLLGSGRPGGAGVRDCSCFPGNTFRTGYVGKVGLWNVRAKMNCPPD